MVLPFTQENKLVYGTMKKNPTHKVEEKEPDTTHTALSLGHFT